MRNKKHPPEYFCGHCGHPLFPEPIWTRRYSTRLGVKTYKIRLWCPNKRFFFDSHQRYYQTGYGGDRHYNEFEIREMFDLLEVKDG